jgi:hypothetical protein
MHRFSYIVAATFIIFGFPSALVHAAAGYTVSPLVIDVDAKARDILTRTITITNTGSQPVTVFPTVNNISLKEGGTIDTFLPPVESDRTASLASWIEIKRLGVDLQQGESKVFDVTFRIHPTPVAGTYHALIGFGYGRNRDEAEAQVKNGQAPGTVVTLTIEDETNEFLKLAKFIVDRFVTSPDNEAAVYSFRNPGDEVLVPKGEIILYDNTGKEVGSVSVNAENISIPPGGEHTFTGRIPTEGMFGKYKAFLSVEYGSTQRASVQDTSFYYVLPLKKMLLILFILAVLVMVGAWYIHKKYLDTESHDADRLMFHVRETESESREHDVNLKQK